MQLPQLQKGIRQRAHSVLFTEIHKFFSTQGYFYFGSVWDPIFLSHEKTVPVLKSWGFNSRQTEGWEGREGLPHPLHGKVGIRSPADSRLLGFCLGFFDLSFGFFFKTAMLWDCTEKLFDPQCHFESKLMSWQFSTKACPTSQTACFCCFWDELDFHRREPSPLFSKDFPAKQSNCVSQAQSSEGTEACWIQKSNLFPQAVYVLY